MHRSKSSIGKQLDKRIAQNSVRSLCSRALKSGPPYGPSPIQVYGNRGKSGKTGVENRITYEGRMNLPKVEGQNAKRKTQN